MASLPLLSSNDGVEIVAALLGYARATPSDAGNVRILDTIFNEVIDSIRIGLPLRVEIEAGAAAVASLINALHEHAPPTFSAANRSRELEQQQQNFGHPQQQQQPLPHPYPHPTTPTAQHLIHTATPNTTLSGPLATPQAPRQMYQLAQIPVTPGPHPSTPQSQSHQGQQHAQLQSFYLTAPNPKYPTLSPILPAGHPYAQGAVGSNAGQLAPNALAAEARPARRPPRKKRYHDAVPSTHCHICCRPSTAVPMAVCSNIKEGTCRKVVCNRCISDNGWDWEEASSESSRWICPHCADACTKVPRAQCWVYMRTNSRRRMNGLRKKARTISEAGVSSGSVTNASVSNGVSTVSSALPVTASQGVRPQLPLMEYHGAVQGHASLAGRSAFMQSPRELPPTNKPDDSSALEVQIIADGNGKKERL